jgi:hypothetical protein
MLHNRTPRKATCPTRRWGSTHSWPFSFTFNTTPSDQAWDSTHACNGLAPQTRPRQPGEWVPHMHAIRCTCNTAPLLSARVERVLHNDMGHAFPRQVACCMCLRALQQFPAIAAFWRAVNAKLWQRYTRKLLPFCSWASPFFIRVRCAAGG